MEFLSENWMYILVTLLFLFVCIYGIMSGKAKNWLMWAVSVAEQDLGSGTGQLKLHKVYDMFMERFPMFSRIVPFFVFSDWVDLALNWMDEQLSKNPNIKNVIEGEQE